MTLEDLIAALEAAKEPSQGLDAKVGFFVGRCSAEDAACGCAPPYTRFIDSALTLVPLKWRWLVRTRDRHEKMDFARVESPDFRAEIWHAGGRDTRDILSGREEAGLAATPALALCIAALKARDSATPDTERSHNRDHAQRIPAAD